MSYKDRVKTSLTYIRLHFVLLQLKGQTNTSHFIALRSYFDKRRNNMVTELYGKLRSVLQRIR